MKSIRTETVSYGRAKLACEERLWSYAVETGAEALIYRFPNVFGKWCRPNYNSAVATFCHNIANDLPITVNDPSTELELVYIDDLAAELLAALSGQAHRCNYDGLTPIPGEDFCRVPVTHRVTLGRIVELLHAFRAQPETLLLPEIPAGSFAKKLYSTYLSYLPSEKTAFPLKMNVDARGSFTELLKTEHCGQFSVNITKPGVTKGQHWQQQAGIFYCRGRARADPRAAVGLGRDSGIRGQWRENRGRSYAAGIYPQHHEPQRYRRAGDGDVGKRMLRLAAPGYVL